MSKVKPINRIISAKDYGGGAKAYIRKWQQSKMRQGIPVLIRDLDKPAKGPPLQAIIWQGQWIVRTDCCNSASFVDPDEPIAICFSCANRSNDNKPRPVIFPPEEDRKEIERLLLERPVNDVAGLTDMERAGLAQPLIYVEVDETIIDTPPELIAKYAVMENPPEIEKRIIKHVYPLVRSWEGESIEQLRSEQEIHISNWRKMLKEES